MIYGHEFMKIIYENEIEREIVYSLALCTSSTTFELQSNSFRNSDNKVENLLVPFSLLPFVIYCFRLTPSPLAVCVCGSMDVILHSIQPEYRWDSLYRF